MIRSSYIQHNYADVFEAVIYAYRPTLCVELGVLDGYSTEAILSALERWSPNSQFDAYDLFEHYEYKHANYEDVLARFIDRKITILQTDAFLSFGHYQDRSVDFLHVDLSNTGETVSKIMTQWDRKMMYGGVILFEGGSEERDRVDWMTKYGFPPIKTELEENKIIEQNYIFGTYLKFPSLTMLLKKR